MGASFPVLGVLYPDYEPPVGQLYEHKSDALTIEVDMSDRITTVKR